MGRSLASLVGALALVVALPVRAQAVDDTTRSAARDVGYAGVQAYQRGEYTLALEKLEKAYRALRVPSLGLWSARALSQLGKLVEASERYREVARLDPSGGDLAVQKQAQADAANELDAIVRRIPGLLLQIDGASAGEVTVTLDGNAVNPALISERLPVNPGAHHLVAARGEQRATADAEVREGETKSVRLRFATGTPDGAAHEPPQKIDERDGSSTPAAHSGSLQRTLGWVALGAGGVGLAAGAVSGVITLQKRSDLESNGNCRNDQCLRSEQSKVDSFNRMRTVSSIGFIAGGVLGATGVVLLLTAHSASDAHLGLAIAPGALTLRGRF